ncbi:hypothetical protein CEE37_04610 [candidate division LCP-89 bacterium B3_LCP]|uniref:Uncharacterized protein n=1 Tax=candidate division LCP-89 bacterium B3_LCP TaxID=2012998 RepID=A0A532V3R0_UNCL8|nr:MAG: hypothetical protein CEE37_04610 [candidate division LCP-89 bacterium B3_LCP]
MKWFITVILCIIIPLPAIADMIYLKNGDVFAGTITRLDSSAVELKLSDGTVKLIDIGDVFRATDDSGNVLYDGSLSPVLPPDVPQQKINPEVTSQQPLLSQDTGEYRKVIKFPLWPLLGGTAILGYVGVTQLSKSAKAYEDSQVLEELGMDFTSKRNQSARQQTLGQISVAGAVACLLIGLTPKYEKVPLKNNIRVTPSPNGFTLSLNF